MTWKFWKKKEPVKEEKKEINKYITIGVDRYIMIGFAPHPLGGLSASTPTINYTKKFLEILDKIPRINIDDNYEYRAIEILYEAVKIKKER